MLKRIDHVVLPEGPQKTNTKLTTHVSCMTDAARFKIRLFAILYISMTGYTHIAAQEVRLQQHES